MRAIILFASLALAGCATASGNMLDDRTMYISGSGTAFSNMGQVQRAILQRAATEGQRRGFTHFVIMDAADRSWVATVTTPAQGSASGSCSGGYCSGTASYTGAQSFSFPRPGADIVIRFLSESEAYGVQGAWAVASILATNPAR